MHWAFTLSSGFTQRLLIADFVANGTLHHMQCASFFDLVRISASFLTAVCEDDTLFYGLTGAAYLSVWMMSDSVSSSHTYIVKYFSEASGVPLPEARPT